jgi:hypothetical protein
MCYHPHCIHTGGAPGDSFTHGPTEYMYHGCNLGTAAWDPQIL